MDQSDENQEPFHEPQQWQYQHSYCFSDTACPNFVHLRIVEQLLENHRLMT